MICPPMSKHDNNRHRRARPGRGLSIFWILALAVSTLLPATVAAAAPAIGTQLYRIQLGEVVIGASRIIWKKTATGVKSDGIVHITAMLDQHQHLQLDNSGLPIHYRLEATVQGQHRTIIEVNREAGAIREVVIRDGHRSQIRLPSKQPIDWLDNNSFGSLQALLSRHHDRLQPGTTLRVFVPQARQFGRFEVISSSLKSRWRLLKCRLTVGRDSVPLELAVDSETGRLLGYHQPKLRVKAILTPPGGPVP